MKIFAKIALVAAVALALLVFAALLVIGDTNVARWIYNDDGRTSAKLLERAAPAWNLDVKNYRYLGVRSTKGWVIVHRWERRDGGQTDVVDVSSVEGLVCYSRRSNDSGEFKNVGCQQYPE